MTTRFPRARTTLALCLLAAGCAPLSLPAGVEIIDGDTLRLDGERVRLHGIDAPEAEQWCAGIGDGPTWPCGQAATDRLRDLIVGTELECRVAGNRMDGNGRPVVRCFADGVDVAGALVLDGLAWADVRYSFAYLDEESVARAERRGVWAVPNVPPWEWRRGRRD